MQAAAASAREHEANSEAGEAHQAGFLLGARWGRRKATVTPELLTAGQVARVVERARLQWDSAGRHEPLTAAITRAVLELQEEVHRG